MDLGILDRIALVLGAAGGLVSATARKLSAQGGDRDDPAALAVRTRSALVGWSSAPACNITGSVSRVDGGLFPSV